jgi:hypothetical protein
MIQCTRVILILVCLCILWPLHTSAQVLSLREFGAGISTAWINGANQAREPMTPEILLNVSDSTAILPGGSFDGQQAGIGTRFRFNLGDSTDFSLMLGADYLFYRGNWRIPLQTGSVMQEHAVDMTVGVLGLEYVVLKFNKLARLYTSAEARASYLHSSFYNWQFKKTNGELIQERGSTDAKPSAFRLGAALRLGVTGEFREGWIVDTSIGYGAINLAGRDDVRGELLTTSNDFETKESTLGNILFSLMIMYRI